MSETVKFKLIPYQNKILSISKTILTDLEKMLLIRLANCFGKNGLVCPKDSKLAVWIGRIDQDLYDKKDKTKAERLEIRRARSSVSTVLARLRKKGFLESELINGNIRKIYLIDVESGYRLGVSTTIDTSEQGCQQELIGCQPELTQVSTPVDSPFIKDKINLNIKSGALNTDSKSRTQKETILRFRTPKDVRNKGEVKSLVNNGLDILGFEIMSNILEIMKQESHKDFAAVLQERIQQRMI